MKLLKSLLIGAILAFNGLDAAGQQEPKPKLHHVLLFQWVEDLDPVAKTEVIDLFKGLPSQVEGFEKIEIIDLAESMDGYDTVIIQVFSSEEALKSYEAHPDHQKIAQIGPSLLSGFSLYDYWN